MLECEFLGIKLCNPFTVGAGLARDDFLKECLESMASIVTMKTCTLEPMAGNPEPNIHRSRHGTLNNIGLKNPGAKKTAELIRWAKGEYDKPIIASVASETPSGFAYVVEEVARGNPDFIELNLSCPNIQGSHYFTESPRSTEVAVAAARTATDIPIIAKLGATDNIKNVALAAVNAGVQAIAAINTIPSMFVMLVKGKPLQGGLSGPAIKPIALRCVYELNRVVDVPIIGMGGINHGQNALEFIEVGADLVGIVTAAWHNGITQTFEDLCDQAEFYLAQNERESLVGLKP